MHFAKKNRVNVGRYIKLGKTIAEKILAKAARKPEVSPGEYIQARNTSRCLFMGTDMEPRMPKAFKKLGWDEIWDPEKLILAPEHSGSYTRVGSEFTNRESHRITSEWAREMGVPEENILELGRIGIGHHMSVEDAWALPGSFYPCGDNHTITVGGIGAFGFAPSASSSFFMRFGWIWLRVPGSVKFIIKGKLKDGIMGRDVFEYILKEFGPTVALNKVAEYTGPVIDAMSIDGRCSMCCLSVFIGAKTGIVNPDKKVIDWYKARTKEPFEPLTSDPDATYVATYEINGSKIEPMVVVPPHRHTVKNIAEVEGTPITNAFIGSCASGRDEDMEAAARILKGRKVHPRVLFNITPGSTAAMLRVDKEGVIQTLLEAGAFVCAPGCSMCPGFYTPLAKNEVCITSSTQNNPGRMGDESAQVYLASPATVAASAIEGKITDPRKYL